MALFGPQLIYTLIMFVLLTKLGKFYSFGRYLLCHKLFRYLSPNSDDLKKAVRNHYKTKNKKLNRLFEIDDSKEEFNIPEGATIELNMAPVNPYDLYYIKYTDDFQSFVDISVTAILIYITTEIYLALFRSTDEINLSVVWCAMVLMLGLSNLCTIALNYLRTSEASLLYVFAGFSFVVSLIVQLADTKFFDFNLKQAFQNCTSNFISALQVHLNMYNDYTTDSTTSSSGYDEKPTTGTTSQRIYSQIKTYSSNELIFTCFLAFLSAIIGALLFFPAFRLARLHYLCLKYSNNSKVKRFLFYFNFLFPLLISLCWFNASSLKVNRSVKSNETMEANESQTSDFLSYITFAYGNVSTNTTSNQIYYIQQASHYTRSILQSENLKIYFIAFIVLLRLILYRHYAQAYLNLAFELASALRQGSTRITNVKYMKTVSSIYQYYGVVASQYVMPLFIVLFMSFLLKTLGNYSWCGVDAENACNMLVNSTASYFSSLRHGSSNSDGLLKQFETKNFNLTLSHTTLTNIFTPFVLRSFIGYFTFWTVSIWFMISCFGLLYYHYIDRHIVLE